MNWFKFENLIFDPCIKEKALNFFWDTLLVPRLQDIHSRYKILIVHQSGVSQINLEGSRAEKDRGGALGAKVGLILMSLTQKLLIFMVLQNQMNLLFFGFARTNSM